MMKVVKGDWTSMFPLWNMGYYFEHVRILCCPEPMGYASLEERSQFSAGCVDGWDLSLGPMELRITHDMSGWWQGMFFLNRFSRLLCS